MFCIIIGLFATSFCIIAVLLPTSFRSRIGLFPRSFVMAIGFTLGIRGFSRRFAVIKRSPASPKKRRGSLTEKEQNQRTPTHVEADYFKDFEVTLK